MVLVQDQILAEHSAQRLLENRCGFVDRMFQVSRILPPGEEIKRLLEWAGTDHGHSSTRSRHQVWGGGLGKAPNSGLSRKRASSMSASGGSCSKSLSDSISG